MKKITFIFALLCASVMGWAGVSEGEYISSTDPTYNNQFKWYSILGKTAPMEVVNFQDPHGLGLYLNVGTAAYDGVKYNGISSDGFYKQDAGVWLFVGQFTARCTTVEIVNGENVVCAFRVLNEAVEGEDCPSGSGGEDPEEPEEINWNEVSWLTNSNENFKVVVSPAGPTISQEQDWKGRRCIYVTYADANFGACSLDASLHDTQGAGKFYYTSAFLDQETEFTQIHNGTTYTFTVYNAHPVTVPASKASTPTVPASRVKGVYSMYDFNTGYTFANWCGNVKQSSALVIGRNIPFYQMGNSCFGMEYRYIDVSNMTKIHLDIWTENTFNINFYLISPGHETYYTIALTGGEWNAVDIPLSTYTAAGVELNNVYQFKFNEPSIADQTIFIDNIYFYAETDVDPEPLEEYDVNFALQTKGAIAAATSPDVPSAALSNKDFAKYAIDNDNGTRWQSDASDAQTLTVDLGQRRIFNTVQIRWEGAYASAFTIDVSNDNSTWTTVKTVTGQSLVGFPNEQIYDFAKTTARYIRFNGTTRASGYGYSFYEFRVLLAGTPVLTSVDISSDKTITKVGEYATLTVAPKDQNGSSIVADLSYTVSPVGAGHVTEGKYYPLKYGLATITVTATTSNAEVSNSVQVWGVVSDNLALNNALDGVGTWYNTDTPPAKAVDGIDNDAENVWQGCTTNTTSADPTARTYDAWFVIDLKGAYSLQLLTIHFEGACSDAYKLYGSTNNVDWTEIYSYAYPDPQTGNRTWNHTDKISANDMANAGNVRYLKFISTRAASEWGVKIYELQVFGEDAATPTKSVSATPNNVEYGSASVVVKSSGLAPEGGTVETGTEVTFSATPNDGYIFVNWSNGETNASFDAVVNSAMNLTANFRALGNIYCNTLVHSSNVGQDHDAYVTMKRTAENTYQLIVRADYQLGNFSNTEFRIKELNAENTSNYNLNNKGVLSADNHTLTGTIISTIEPEMISGKLYVNIVGKYEGQFDRLTNIEYAVACADPEITAIELNKTEATLDMGNSLTLVPTFTPAYMSADIEWLTSDDAVATVANGVVTPVAPGTATITAKISETVKATCAVTVQAAASHNWYGYGTDKDLDYTYRIEFNTDHRIVAHVKRQGDKGGLVDASMEINKNNVWTTINVTEGEEEGWAKGTTEATYTAGDNIHILIQSNFTGASSIIEFDYEVGSDNVMPTIVPSVLKLSNSSISMSIDDADVQLTAEIHHRDAANPAITWTSDDENVVTVENGLVHPVGVGTTTVRAATFNDFEATCTVTVVGVLEPTTWYGTGKFQVHGNPVAFNYSITRTVEHKLIYQTHLSEPIEGVAMKINHNDNWYTMSQDESKRNATYTNNGPFIDGDPHNFYFRAEYANGADNWDVSYIIGTEDTEPNDLLALYDAMDNSNKISIHDNDLMDVELSRTFPNTDEWYTLCLPFDLSDEQLVEAFGAGYTLATLENSEDHGSLISLNFDFVHSFEAGKAYLLRPGTAVTENPVFEGVVVKNVDPEDVAATSTYMNFQGTFNTIVLDNENQRFVGPENYLYSPAEGGTNMKAFRCFFTIPAQSPLNGAPAKPARIVFGEQTATGMESVQGDNVQGIKVLMDGQLFIIREGRIYNAQGTLVK